MSEQGLENLRNAFLADMSERLNEVYEDHTHRCESPIEKLLMAAMLLRAGSGMHEYGPFWVRGGELTTAEAAALLLTEAHPLQLIIQPQAKPEIGADWRVDFLVTAPAYTSDRPFLRRLIVECDGHDFHERTKAQAARDRSRDRMAQSRNVQVYRFTGSEIHRDAWGCAGQVLDWAAWGLR